MRRNLRACDGSSTCAPTAQLLARAAHTPFPPNHRAARNPASWCGVVGLRTTPGLVPEAPPAAPPPPAARRLMSTGGPMARCVRDAALFLDAMVDHSAAESSSSRASSGSGGGAGEGPSSSGGGGAAGGT